jgi:hypothetical protein
MWNQEARVFILVAFIEKHLFTHPPVLVETSGAKF